MSRTAPKTRPLTISLEERTALEALTEQGAGSKRAAKRARIVLLCAEIGSNERRLAL